MQIRRRPPSPAIQVSYLQYQVAAPGAEPLHLLEKIVWHKENEVDALRDRLPLLDLRKQLPDAAPPLDALAALRQVRTTPSLIAEVKKASPSKGVIRPDFDPVAIAQAYAEHGATCISVLTDEEFFQGSFDYLKAIRAAVDIPLLCKDFIIYPYQIYKARTCGADLILLIAAILSDADLQYFLKIVRTVGMTALVEVHTLEELDRVLALDGVQLVGINNRDLETFHVDLQTTCQIMAERRQALQERDIIVVSESGIHTAADVQTVTEAGVNAILVGESLMRQDDPGAAIASLLS
ncbi:MAG TPA: indole-3-glycerol phosphate synthase TrpC [Candidatus Obscuribacterales bacterium]